MKYTVITGASSGIGYAGAIQFAKRGANLILVARREDRLQALKQKLTQEFPLADCVVCPADLSDDQRCVTLYDHLKQYQIETWINNAGVGVYGAVADHDIHAVQAMLHLNVEALTILSNLFVRDYKDVPGTQLINISSAGGYAVVQNAVTYCATKFYVGAFTEGLALELQRQHAQMKVKLLAPFLTETEFAQVANHVAAFDYGAHYQKYHTSDEMAQFLLALYDSDKMVGRVSREDFTFSLTGPQFSHASPSK